MEQDNWSKTTREQIAMCKPLILLLLVAWTLATAEIRCAIQFSAKPARPVEPIWRRAERRIPTWNTIQRLGLCRVGLSPPPRSRRPQSAETLFRHGLTDLLAIVVACTSLRGHIAC